MVSEDKPTFLEDCKKEMAVIIIQQMNDQYMFYQIKILAD